VNSNILISFSCYYAWYCQIIVLSLIIKYLKKYFDKIYIYKITICLCVCLSVCSCQNEGLTAARINLIFCIHTLIWSDCAIGYIILIFEVIKGNFRSNKSLWQVPLGFFSQGLTYLWVFFPGVDLPGLGFCPGTCKFERDFFYFEDPGAVPLLFDNPGAVALL